MKSIKISILFLLVPILLKAQIDSTISFIAYWDKGDSKTYNIIKKHTQIKDGTITIDRISDYHIKCTVIKSKRNGYTIEWINENPAFSNFEIPEEFDKVLSKYKNQRILYKTDPYGMFQEIVNWEEIQKMMYTLLDKITGMISTDSVNVSGVVKTFKDMYASKESIADLLLKEIGLFHYPMGLVFNTFDTIKYEDEFPNYLGGDPVKANGKLFFQDIDEDAGNCAFVNSVQLDSTGAKQMITDFISDMISRLEYSDGSKKEVAINEMNREFSTMNIQISDIQEFKYNYSIGWPILINSNRTSKIAGKNQTLVRIDELIIKEIN